MSEIDLDELERLHKAATPGPWEAIGPDNTVDRCAHVCARGSVLRIAKFDSVFELARGCDARLVIAARNALPALIARIRELDSGVRLHEAAHAVDRKRIAALEGALRGAIETHDHEGCPGADCYVLRDAFKKHEEACRARKEGT